MGFIVVDDENFQILMRLIEDRRDRSRQIFSAAISWNDDRDFRRAQSRVLILEFAWLIDVDSQAPTKWIVKEVGVVTATFLNSDLVTRFFDAKRGIPRFLADIS